MRISYKGSGDIDERLHGTLFGQSVGFRYVVFEMEFQVLYGAAVGAVKLGDRGYDVFCIRGLNASFV